MSAQSFLRAFHRDVKVTTSSADKAKAFKMYLVPGSEVDDWFAALPAPTRADMDLIDIALDAQYPSEATVQPTQAEYATDLLMARLTMEELGTKVKLADHDVWAHHAWANKTLRLATKAGVAATTTYIEQVRRELPAPLRTKLGKVHANWAAFAKAIRDVDTGELEQEMKEKREEKEERNKLARLVEQRTGAQASPTAGIRAQLTNARIGAPVPNQARWPQAAGANPFQGSGGQGNLFAPQQPLEGEHRRIFIEAIARITHHPDTETGRRAHSAQQQDWVRVHGNVDPTVDTPYPLRPGCAPANSGECFRCGHQGHTNFQQRCTALREQALNPKEQRWRRIATAALKEPAAAVRAVGFPSWDVDDYGRPYGADEERFEEVEEQGNA
ncbi:hypothetical protein C8R46DRAFT_924451 [Mycena filopes]|nr:hypothetical protein C8R46DRAFT_924451 [Mycena filopes]